jgi:CheY-like chemotaxis protein
VDDNEDAAVLLSEVLSSVGHQVKTGGDAIAALRLAEEFRPDVAILDIGLPVMDGHALAARLRAELGPLTPRLIAVTGYGQRNDRQRSAAAGFDAHLVKPVDMQQLLALLTEFERTPEV